MRSLVLAVVLLLAVAVPAGSEPSRTGAVAQIDGLQEAGSIARDERGIAHLRAANEHDLWFLQGWVHAEDRLFQMDLLRRQASGTLAEVLGRDALASDVEARTIGLGRAAERTLSALSDDARAALEDYAEGVNAWVAANDLPQEYALLQLTTFEPWTALDSAVAGKALAFNLSFDLDIRRTRHLEAYQAAGRAHGFDGAALFRDVFRITPFTDASTVPDALDAEGGTAAPGRSPVVLGHSLPEHAVANGRRYLERIEDLPMFAPVLDETEQPGSNEWGVRGDLTDSGRPMIANDPHLSLDTPSTFYPIHLKAPGIDVYGEGFAGVPTVVLGHNKHIAWGATTNPMDVTDMFAEQVVPSTTSPSGLAIVNDSETYPIVRIPETYRYNTMGDGLAMATEGVPPATLVVPFRNHGPIVELDREEGTALSVQYTGFSATRELETFYLWNKARNLDDFRAALEKFDVGSQNWAYADDRGNVAYFTSAEMPLREDLQAGTVDGRPPWFVRDGTGGNDWLPATTLQPGQAIPYEILPYEEMPHLVNPPWFVNANNDPAGTTLDGNPLDQLRPGGGIYYLNVGYDGFRAGRITERLRRELGADGSLSFADMQSIQADVVMIDAEVLAPELVAAFDRAEEESDELTFKDLAEDAGVAEAIERLRRWDGSTPTGLQEGWDAGRPAGTAPTAAEIDASVAATIYSVWRGQLLDDVLGATLATWELPTPGSGQALSALRALVESEDGHGATSGVDFFDVAEIEHEGAERDAVLLTSLRTALDALASEDFAAAFSGSTDQDDYRWGKLHRVVFDHPLGEPFSVPPAEDQFPAPLQGLPGIPTDGGFGVVDASSHSAYADDLNGFMFGSGPVRRFVAEPARGYRGRVESSLPGGTSGVLGSPWYVNLLDDWLANNSYPQILQPGRLRSTFVTEMKVIPAR